MKLPRSVLRRCPAGSGDGKVQRTLWMKCPSSRRNCVPFFLGHFGPAELSLSTAESQDERMSSTIGVSSEAHVDQAESIIIDFWWTWVCPVGRASTSRKKLLFGGEGGPEVVWVGTFLWMQHCQDFLKSNDWFLILLPGFAAVLKVNSPYNP